MGPLLETTNLKRSVGDEGRGNSTLRGNALHTTRNEKSWDRKGNVQTATRFVKNGALLSASGLRVPNASSDAEYCAAGPEPSSAPDRA